MCPAGYVQEKTGESACVSLNWVHAEDCTSEQFLNDTGNRTLWKCEPCLEGASCVGAVTSKDLPNMFGWWKIPRDERDQQVFAPCLYPPACPGGPNPSLSGTYIDAEGEDVSNKMLLDAPSTWDSETLRGCVTLALRTTGEEARMSAPSARRADKTGGSLRSVFFSFFACSSTWCI